MLHTSQRLVVAAFGATLAVGSPARAQDASPRTHAWEFLVSSGRLLPTGAQRDVLKAGNLTSAQVTFVINPIVAVTSSLGWARSRDASSADDAKLNVFMYDIGAELRAPFTSAGDRVTARPFAGVGLGARSYSARSLEKARHHPAGYLAAGGEVGTSRVRLRLEGRDYLTRFSALDGRTGAQARNDVVLMAGLRIGRQ